MIFLIFFSLLLQQFKLDIGISSIKLFMLVGISLFFFNLKRIIIDRLTTFEIFLLVLYFILFLSSLYGDNQILALKADAGMLLLLFTYFVFRSLSRSIQIEQFERYFMQISKIYIFSSIILYIIGFIFYYFYGTMLENEQHLLGLYRQGNLPRLCGLANSPNNFALYAMVFLYFAWYKKQISLFILTLLSIILTLSTTVYLSLFSGLLLIIVNEKKWGLIFYGLIIIFIFIFIYFYSDFFQLIVNERISRNTTGSGRTEIWDYAFNLIAQHPIFGYGTNQSHDLIAPIRDLNSTHNTFLEVWISSGIFGLIAYIAFMMVLMITSTKLDKNYDTLFFSLLFINYFLFSMANNLLIIDYNIFYFLILKKYISNNQKIFKKNR